ncbi:MAG: hypothetical protein ACYDDI_13065 [Candidatus Acidiferrales bacterium]
MKKLFVVVVGGALASFALTMIGELLVSSMSISGWQRYVWLFGPEFPLIAVVVGVLVGLVMRERAQAAAALSLAPWAAWLIIGTNWGHSTVSRWVTTAAIFSVYYLLGIGAATLVGRRMARFTARSGPSPS